MLPIPSSDDFWIYSQDKPTKERRKEWWSQYSNVNIAMQAQSVSDTQVKAGNLSSINRYNSQLFQSNSALNFNRVLPAVNMICGRQRANRKSTIAVPVEHNDDQAATDNTDLLFHIWKNSSSDEVLSQAFEDMVTTGLSLINVTVDYTEDPVSGDIKAELVPMPCMLIDPYFRKRDMSDANVIWRRQMISPMQAQFLAPEGMHEVIAGMKPRYGGTKDGRFSYMGEIYNWGTQNLLAWDEIWYKDTRQATFVIDPVNGISKEWEGTKEQLKVFLSHFPQIKVHKTLVPTVKLMIAADDRTLYDGPNPLGIDAYPFAPCIGYHNPDIPNFVDRFQGPVRSAVASQFIYTHRQTMNLKTSEAQVQSGFIYKPTSLVNPQDIFLRDAGKGIPLKAEAEMTDIIKIEQPDIRASQMEMAALMAKEVLMNMGINEELMGTAVDDKAGILAMLRQGAGLVGLNTIFDSADYTQKILGKLYLQIAQRNYTKGKVQRILGREVNPEWENKTFLKYDIRIEEGPNTTTARQLTFQQLMQLKELGVPVPSEFLLENLTIQDKSKMVEQVKAQEQQSAKAQSDQAAAQIAVLKAQIKDLEARASANTSLGLERVSRVDENEALARERTAQSHRDEAAAGLDRVKAIKELDHMRLDGIQKALGLLNILEQDPKEDIAPQQMASALASQPMQGAQQASQQASNPYLDGGYQQPGL